MFFHSFSLFSQALIFFQFEWIILLNEYSRFNFELNIELNHFFARFNVKMNNQNISATPSAGWALHHEGSLFWLELPCREAAGTSRYSFIWTSPLAWINSLSLVNNDGYYLATTQKTKEMVTKTSEESTDREIFSSVPTPSTAPYHLP